MDGQGSAALGVIKGEEPPLTAAVAIEDTNYAIEENAQASVI